jgi:hypothetical protein
MRPVRSGRLLSVAILASLALAACGGGDSDGGSGGSGTGGGGGSGGAGGTVASGPYGLFDIHYITGASAADSYTDVGGVMYDGPPAELVVWDKKKTEGDCSLYTPRTPFCSSCTSPTVCVDTEVCRTPPATHDVGKVTLTGLNPPSGANPLELTMVATTTRTTYLCAETLPMPPCAAGGAIALNAAGKGDYPAFAIQAACIAPLAVTNTAVQIESGKTFTLNWTPSTIAGARLQLTFDLSHHGGSKGKIICDTADSGSLSVSATLMTDLIALGVTGYPKAYVTRVLTGTTTVGTGQAQLKVYSDVEFVAQLPGLVSCETNADCTGAGETCQVPGQMCGVSCATSADCTGGKTCLTTTKICG